MKPRTVADTDYALVFASCASPKLIVAPDAPRFTITDVNQAYLDATMRTREELVGMALFEAMPDNPDDPAANGTSNLRTSIERAIATGCSDRMATQKYDIPHPGGGFEERWWDPINTPLIGASGTVDGVLHQVLDATERVRAQAGLLALNADLQAEIRRRAQAEERQQFLMEELSHRLKNTLTVVQAIASQTLGSLDIDALDMFGKRLAALASAHDVLLQRDWTEAKVREVADRALATFEKDEQISADGPELVLGPRATLALSLMLHELATNAIKYGALSTPTGCVDLSWSVAGDGDDGTVAMQWAERDGPPVVAPTRKGFGSRIIRMGLCGSGGVTLRYEEKGFTADMTATVGQLRLA